MTSYILDLFRRRKPKSAPRVEPPLYRQPIVPKDMLKDDEARQLNTVIERLENSKWT